MSLSNSVVSRRAGLLGKENRGVGAVVVLVGGSTAGVGATRKLGFGGGGGGGGAVADSAIVCLWLVGSSLYLSLDSTLRLLYPHTIRASVCVALKMMKMGL